MSEKYSDTIEELKNAIIKLQKEENELKEKIEIEYGKNPTVPIDRNILMQYQGITSKMLDAYDSYSIVINGMTEAVKSENREITYDLFRISTECNLNYLSYSSNYNNDSFESNLKKAEEAQEEVKKTQEKLKEAQEESNKNVMTIMGIFLAIFSVIGVNSSILVGIFGTLKGISVITVPVMINSFVLIIIAFIFSMIKDDGLKKMICRLAFPVTIFLIVLVVQILNTNN
jgi:prefoldin subunit 5